MASAVSNPYFHGGAPHGVSRPLQSLGLYDYDCKNDYLEGCLQNDITLYGPNVVLINLDNRCQVEKYMATGVFL